KTLKTSPTHGGANQGLSEALRHQGQADEAGRLAPRPRRFGGPQRARGLPPPAPPHPAPERAAGEAQVLPQAPTRAGNEKPPPATDEPAAPSPVGIERPFPS